VIDVRDDREVADAGELAHLGPGAGRCVSPRRALITPLSGSFGLPILATILQTRCPATPQR
jgi:hypothetical protein